MRDLRNAVLMTVFATVSSMAGCTLAVTLLGVGTSAPVAPLVSPPQCEQPAETGFCYLDLSDGREYVVYVDKGQLSWFVQDWRDGSP